jgi:hypothetical protein
LVTITGINFPGITEVTFNGTPAAFTVNSPTMITATVPNGATSGPISVQSRAGIGFSIATGIQSFTVVGAAASPTVLNGVAVRVTGFRFNNATNRFVQSVRLTNVSGQDVAGPISYVLDSLVGGLAISDGITAAVPPLGSPFVDINVGSDNVFSAGENVAVVLEFVRFPMPPIPNQPISYVARILTGPGPR